MSEITIEMLEPEAIDTLWPALHPMYTAACDAHSIAKMELSADDIYKLGVTGMAAIFVGFVDGTPACTVAIQFNNTNGRKGADLIAMGGAHLMLFRAAYWDLILDWLKANGVEFLDAYVPEERVPLYRKKFGFDMSCGFVRRQLH